MRYKIFVINLDSCVERMDFMKGQFSRFGLEYERFSAVDIRKASQTEIEKYYSLKENRRCFYKDLNLGEVGCYLSHYRCWEKIVQENLDFAIILEDEAQLSEDFEGFIHALERNPIDWDFIKLAEPPFTKERSKSGKATALSDRYYLSKYLKLASNTTAQAVSFEGAKKLIKTALPVRRPVDVDIKHWFEKGLNCRIAYPLPVSVRPFSSEITKSGERKKAPCRRLQGWQDRASYELTIFSIWVKRLFS